MTQFIYPYMANDSGIVNTLNWNYFNAANFIVYTCVQKTTTTMAMLFDDSDLLSIVNELEKTPPTATSTVIPEVNTVTSMSKT